MVRMSEEEARRLAEEIYGKEQIGHSGRFQTDADEKNSPHRLDATADEAQNVAPRQMTFRNIWRRLMGKMTVEQLDEYRAKKGRRRSTALTVVPPVAPSQVAPAAPLVVAPLAPVDVEYRELSATAPRSSRFLDALMYLGSFGLCAFAALYSVQGLVEFFAFSPYQTLAMAGTMELVKFIGVSWTAANWHTLHWWRLAVVPMLMTMAAITFIGDYVHLTQSHIGNRPEIIATLQRELADVERKIAAKKQTEAGNKQTADITTKAAEKLIAQGQPKAALKAVEKKSAPTQSASTEPSLEAQADELRAKLAVPSKVQFLATLTGRDDETISVWLILFLTLMLDPFGLALNAAVASRR
jgi:hypothetical protein